MIGQEFVELAGFWIPVANPPKVQFLVLAEDDNHMVGSDASAFPNRVSFENFVHGVGLEPGDEEQPRGAEGPKPGIVDVCFVEDGDGPLGEPEHLDHLGVMKSGIGDTDKGRQVSVVIEDCMDFEATPFSPIGCPWKGGQAELDDRGIEAVEFGFEAELMPRSHGRATLVELAENRLKELRWPLGVGIGKGRACHAAQPQMIPGCGCRHACFGDLQGG